MLAIQFQDVGVVTSAEMPLPKLENFRDAIVEVTMAGLCGSDLHPFWGRETGLLPGTVMGHELVGIVRDVGDAIDPGILAVGDRVFTSFSTNCGDCFYCQAGLTSRCQAGQLFGWRQQDGDTVAGLHGCQSQFVRVPLADATLKKLPDSISDESGLLLGDNFSTGYYCAEMAGIEPAGVYAVIGCGTVGQLCIRAAQAMGATQIVAVDPLETRRQQAEQIGAIPCTPEQALAEIQSRTDGRGADAVMELVGMPPAQQLAYELLRPGGVMSVIGCHCTPDFSFSPVDAYDKNLTYRTGRCPARHYMDQLTPRVAAGEFQLDSLVTHYLGFNQAETAYELFSRRLDGCIKAVFVNR